MKLLRKILLGINIIGILGLIGCYASTYINSDKYWFISMLGLGYFLWMAINIAFALIWIFLKWKYALLSVVTIVIGYSQHTKMIGFNFPKIHKNKENSIKIVSYNVELFKFYDWKKNETQRDRILQFISATEADIYCFQEYFQTKDDLFVTTKKLMTLIPEHGMHFEPGIVKFDNQEYGVATFSKYPIINKGIVDMDGLQDKSNLIIYTDVVIQDDTVRIYNVHLASNHLNTNEVDSIITNNEKTLSFAKKWVKKLKSGYKRRYSQINALDKHLKDCPYSTFIAGDFNDVPVSYTYRKLKRNYEDSFLEAGNGIGATYNGKLPMLRIDYIFHSDNYTCNRFEIHKLNITDHFPIAAELYKKK